MSGKIAYWRCAIAMSIADRQAQITNREPQVRASKGLAVTLNSSPPTAIAERATFSINLRVFTCVRSTATEATGKFPGRLRLSTGKV
jgi:hypothetical protein